MTRRQGLLTLAAIVVNGIASPLKGREANITIDLDLLKTWQVKFGGKTLMVTGEEVFRALQSTQKT
jgi:hypothetical protein